MKNPENFCYKGKLSRATAQSTVFAVSEDEWNTKEDTGKSMKNSLYVLRYAKRHLKYCSMPKGTSQTEVMSNSEKIKSVALACYRVTLV